MMSKLPFAWLTDRASADENNAKLVNDGLLGIQTHADSLRKRSPFAKLSDKTSRNLTLSFHESHLRNLEPESLI